ncbi:hypothetical protein PFISCL1PPCAC_7601 [Pristionchus fissidentatus]|uniref:G protein-coupled receptor n=1 Tax=Pristionchus fissidentatus TaxID=1538716 RepID=A0AAV5VCY5_9BILA|nr:hypothetical protein PFISCL1PPCAC_7601 [Pristionchus fissidentatus]
MQEQGLGILHPTVQKHLPELLQPALCRREPQLPQVEDGQSHLHPHERLLTVANLRTVRQDLRAVRPLKRWRNSSKKSITNDESTFSAALRLPAFTAHLHYNFKMMRTRNALSFYTSPYLSLVLTRFLAFRTVFTCVTFNIFERLLVNLQ